jgi:hypothetical protein
MNALVIVLVLFSLFFWALIIADALDRAASKEEPLP